jgi:NAD(P)-dependent dehydrogenase (short-subunit alcohol dehydrogenase family)
VQRKESAARTPKRSPGKGRQSSSQTSPQPPRETWLAQIEASGGTALGVEVDVADDDAVRAMVDACVERFASS